MAKSKTWIHDLLRSGSFAGLLTALVFQGCAMNPVTGRPDFVLTTTEGERKIGEDAAREVEESMGLTEDPALAAYIEAIGKRLAMQSPRKDVEYQFYVVEMVEPNAFALPGGFVYVSRGLLALANSEDELAGVLGHEIGHVAARHSVRRMSAAAPFALVAGITGGAVGLVSAGYVCTCLWALFSPRATLAARVLAAESQLAMCKRRIEEKNQPRPPFTRAFRLLWVVLSRVWDPWHQMAHLMQPATVKKWHAAAFRL